MHVLYCASLEMRSGTRCEEGERINQVRVVGALFELQIIFQLFIFRKDPHWVMRVIVSPQKCEAEDNRKESDASIYISFPVKNIHDS